jgi:endonuclease/exonuclease/phosphatase (EEP) superfamily protein YafD
MHSFSYVSDGSTIHIAVVYASTLYITRRKLWLELTNMLHAHPGPWLFVGDFNSILGAHERLGGRTPLHIACLEFME